MKYIGLIISMFFMLQARSNDMVITYGDFLLLSPAQKTQTIELIREFMIEFENEQILGEYQSLKKKKRYQVYQKILNFMIDQAHANDQNSNFNMALKQYKDNDGKEYPPCIFAGNLSKMVKDGDRLKCVNPLTEKTTYKDPTEVATTKMGATITSEDYINYHYEEALKYNPVNKTFESADKFNKKCSSKNSAVCNPDLFGKIDGKPICIDVEYDGGYNTTFSCAHALDFIKEEEDREILIDGKGSGQKGKDLYASIMSGILNNSTTSGNSLAPSLHMIADVCLCGYQAGRSDSSHFSRPGNNAYAKYAGSMFGTKTCVGLLTQMQKISEDAKELACIAGQKTPNYATNEDFVRWYEYAQELYRASESPEQQGLQKMIEKGRNDGVEGREDLFLGMGTETLGSYLERQKQNDEQQYRSLADLSFLTAKKRNLCPAANALIKLKLKRDGDQLVAQMIVGEEADTPTGVIPRIVAIDSSLEGAPQSPDFPPTATTGLETTYAMPETTQASEGAIVRAIATVDGQVIESNEVDLTQNGPTTLTASLDGRKLQLLYESCTGSDNCNHGFEQPSVSKTEPEISEITISPCSETGDEIVNSTAGQQTLFCADLSDLQNEEPIKVTFKGKQHTQEVESNELIIPVAGSDFKISGSKTYFKIDNNSPILYSVIDSAQIKFGKDNLDLLETKNKAELNKVKFSPAKLEGDDSEQAEVFIRRENLDPLEVNAEYKNIIATHSFDPIEPVCKIEINETGAKINIETPGLEIEEGAQLFKLKDQKLGISESRSTASSEDSETEDELDTAQLNLAQGENITLEGNSVTIALDTDGLNKIKDLSGKDLQFSLKGLQTVFGQTISCEQTKKSGEINLDGLADNNKCTIEVQKTAFENQMNQQGFRIVASVKENNSDSDDDENEDEESEYSVKIYDMNRPAAKKSKSKKKDKPQNVVLEEESETDEDSKKKKEKTRAVAGLEDSIKDIDKKRVLSTSGSTVMPRRSEAYSVRVVAFRNGVACGVENVEVPVRKADNSNPVQAPMPSGFAPTGGKTFREGI